MDLNTSRTIGFSRFARMWICDSSLFCFCFLFYFFLNGSCLAVCLCMGYISIRTLLYVLMLAGNYFASGNGGEAFIFLRVLSLAFFFSFFPSRVWGIRRTPVPWGCGGQIVAHLQMASRIITRMFAVAPTG